MTDITNISDSDNFCRVFELPETYPSGFCFGGGHPVQMQMVDWFYPIPPKHFGYSFKTWDEVVKELKPQMKHKVYAKKGRQYILITNFGESMMFEGEN